MVIRTSVRDASRRAQTSMSRATLRELNTKPYWSEGKQIDVMASETHSDVEWVQNYGGVSVPVKQDKDENQQQQKQQQQASASNGPGGAGGNSNGVQGQQPKGDSAEAIVGYMNGSRSHPVILAIGDRRHQLLELEEGDVAQHRLKDDRQQVLLHKDGTYISTRDDKVLRAALVPKEQKDQPTPGQAQQAQAQQQKKTHGQKSARDDNVKSEVYIEQKGDVTTVRHSTSYSAQRASDSSTYYQDRKRSTQVTAQHSHLRTNEFRIFTDDEGCWSEVPILVKKDKHCKD